MKKILTVVIALITITTASAQLKSGVRAGYAMSSVKGEIAGKDLKNDIRSTYYVGFFSEYRATESIAVQAELMYSPAGTKNSVKVAGQEVKTTSNYGTLSVPLLVKYYVSPNFSLNVGPSFGFNIYKKGSFNGGKSFDLKDVKTFNFAGLLGLEYTLDSGLFFDARYSMGVTNISGLKGVTVKNNLLTFGLGYKF